MRQLTILIFISFSFIVSSCNNKELHNEINSLKNELVKKDSIISNLENELFLKRLEEERENRKKIFTETEAEENFTYHMDFYKPNIKYKNLKFRRISDNTFDIMCQVKWYTEAFGSWSSYNTCQYRINFKDDNKYILSMQSGPVDAMP